MILPHAILVAILAACAALAPTLTCARLWQIKEWRVDRLREHFRANGWLRPLIGWMRPLMTAAVILLSELILGTDTKGVIVGLFVLASLSIAQSVLSRKRPVWTSKARAIVIVTLGMILVLSLLVPTSAAVGLLLLPLFSPAFVALSWLILKPLDAYLKHRVLDRASKLRASHPNLRVVGITGSVGKTTLKEMLSHILKDSGALTTPERVNTEMGVAAWLTNVLRKEAANSRRILIVEMGAYRRGEIALLCRITKPTYGVITYVGAQHLSLFGSREAIIEAKGELFASLPKDGRAFGNRDNDAYDALKKKCTCPITAVGTDRHADVQAMDIEETSNGIRFKALGTAFNIPVSGTHNVTGTLLAIAVARELGMMLPDIARKLQTFKRMSRTFELKTVGGVTVLDDTYNSSPDSVQAAIEWARKQPHQTKILVLEGIIELGDAEARIHTELASLAAPIFTEAYAAHPRFLSYLRDGGFGDRARMAAWRREKVEKGSLVVFVGRLSPAIMRYFV